MGGTVVFGEYPGAVIAAEDEDGLHREEGHSGRHGTGVLTRRRGLGARDVARVVVVSSSDPRAP